LRHIEGYNTIPNEPLLFGSLVHWIIEQFLEQGTLPDLGVMSSALDLIFVKDQPTDRPVVQTHEVMTASQRKALIKEAVEAVMEWDRGVLPNLPDEKPIVEQTVEAVAGYGFIGDQEYEVVVRGTPDAVYHKAGRIVDWKTTGRKWNADKMDGQIQPILYPWMWEENVVNTDPIHTFDFVIFDRSNGWWNTMSRDVGSPAAIEAACQTAVTAALAIESKQLAYRPSGGGFKARGWHCSPNYCDAWGVCEGKHLVNDGQAELPALTNKERWST